MKGITKRKIDIKPTIELHQNVIDKLFYKLELKNLNDFATFKKTKIFGLSSTYFLAPIYNSNVNKLLETVYPNFPWEFEKIQPTSMEFFNSIENRRKFMDDLYIKLKLESMDDWLNISSVSVSKNGGYSLLSRYSHDMSKLLQSLYPNHDWKFEKNGLISLKKQINIMEKISKKLGIKSIEQWLKITNHEFILAGGKYLLLLNSNDMKKLLKSIFPQFFSDLPFDLTKISNREFFFQSITNQRKYLDFLFTLKKLNSIEDFLHLKKNDFILNGAKYLLLNYSNNIKNMLRKNYPNFPWILAQEISQSEINLLASNLINELEIDEKIKEIAFDRFQLIENQRKFLNYLFIKFKITLLNNWTKLNTNQITKTNGGFILFRLYSNDLTKILNSLYPSNNLNIINNNLKNKINNINKNNNNYEVKFKEIKKITKKYFNKLENQQKFMEELFYQFEYKTMDDFYNLTPSKIIKQGGYSLIYSLYLFDIQKLLKTIYANFPWDFEDFYSINVQRNIFEHLIEKLQIKSINDWKILTIKHFRNSKEINLLSYYSYDIKRLLISLYPAHSSLFLTWKYRKSIRHQYKQIIPFLIKKYFIQSKKDWYRLEARTEGINIFKLLTKYFANEKWHFKNFVKYTKKSKQKFLFSSLQSLFPAYLLIENYRHNLILNTKTALEFDIYIPSLNMAIEYHGQQHFDDIPAIFAPSDSIHDRDEVKINSAKQFGIDIVSIPYWWNLSSSSLISTLNLYLPSSLPNDNYKNNSLFN